MAQLVTKKTVTLLWDPVTKDTSGVKLTVVPRYNVYLGDSTIYGTTGDSFLSITFPTSGNKTIRVTSIITAPDGITKIESAPATMDVTVFLAPAAPVNLRIL
jgi:hypothetical protein